MAILAPQRQTRTSQIVEEILTSEKAMVLRSRLGPYLPVKDVIAKYGVSHATAYDIKYRVELALRNIKDASSTT